MLILDHLAVSCEDLEDGRAYIEDALGVPLQTGGKHIHFGTHNYLLGLGDSLYFEVIARDPNANATGRATWFDLDRFTGAPRLGNWICRSDDFETDFAKAPSQVGQLVSLARDQIKWQLTVPDDGGLPYDGAYPSLINWADGVLHPSEALPDQGVRLMQWVISHPDAAHLSEIVDIRDDRVSWQVGAFGFKATFATPHGDRILR